MHTRTVALLALLGTLTVSPGALSAQDLEPYAPGAVPTERYERAERFLGDFTRPLVRGGVISENWIGDGDAFWFRSGLEPAAWYVVQPSAGTRELAFDATAMAAALDEASGLETPAERLEVEAIDPDVGEVHLRDGDGLFACALDASSCRPVPRVDGPDAPRFSVVSPDGNWAAFQDDWDLWVRDLRTGDDVRLTEGGTEELGWGTNNAGWTRSPRPVVKWSDDSRKLATFRHDSRGIGVFHMLRTREGRPELESWKYPFPEDSVIFRIERAVIDVPTREIVMLDAPIDQHRSTVCDHIWCNGEFADVDWRNGSDALAYVSSSRDHKVATLRIADPETGEVRTVHEEVEETFYESGYDNVNWSVLDDSDEFVWFSAESDWGHLYVHDLDTGERIRPITQGEWAVLQVRRVDEESRTIWFTGAGREPGDPYFEYFYRVDIDSGDITLLTPDSANHVVELSPDGTSFTDRYSTPLIPPTTVVRSADDGRVLVEVEAADASALEDSDWQAPIPFTTKARDGVTDLHGLMYTPSDLDPTRTYPVVNYLYPGPQTGSVGSRNFSTSRRDHQALAELGFIVIEVDAMGTPKRSKSFHEAYYGNMGDNGLPDQVTTIRQLAERHPWIDLDRVGIWGHSGGGFASTAGILRYPDFYRVAVSQAGNHDNRVYEDDWGEKWQGLLVEYEDGTTSYDNQANQLLAENLEGKLLLAHGAVDANVPVQNTFLVADALIEADKDFDMIILPDAGHGFANTPYMMRRRWNYFVEHLMGAEPSAEFRFGQQRPSM
ncbi:MAG TPA: DPP IV N-terminal domain-containing protein [Longimicrobiales bacterium]|nr:DPP IV N-terminal domain-containing protein [Longimicrobiales bacterium]